MIRDAVTRGLAIAERLVVATETIAKELKQLNATLGELTFDGMGETTLGRIETALHDNLQTFGSDDGVSLAAHVARLADHVEDR